ncbi:MAG: hypothetical protein AAFQ08_04025, partial [Bacteroidota bacterium]
MKCLNILRQEGVLLLLLHACIGNGALPPPLAADRGNASTTRDSTRRETKALCLFPQRGQLATPTATSPPIALQGALVDAKGATTPFGALRSDISAGNKHLSNQASTLDAKVEQAIAQGEVTIEMLERANRQRDLNEEQMKKRKVAEWGRYLQKLREQYKKYASECSEAPIKLVPVESTHLD